MTGEIDRIRFALVDSFATRSQASNSAVRPRPARSSHTATKVVRDAAPSLSTRLMFGATHRAEEIAHLLDIPPSDYFLNQPRDRSRGARNNFRRTVDAIL